MERTETHIVTKENGPRPAGPPDCCFYCSRLIGREHAEDCVLRIKTVMVRATTEYPVVVPSHWSKDDIEFHRNEGSWCSSNMIGELQEVFDAGDCLCLRTKFEYLGDADEHNDSLVKNP